MKNMISSLNERWTTDVDQLEQDRKQKEVMKEEIYFFFCHCYICF